MAAVETQLQNYFQLLLARFPGLKAAVVSDRDGVPLLKVTRSSDDEQYLSPSFLAAATIAGEQASKLGMGSTNSFYVKYDKVQIVNINSSPLLVNLIAEPTAQVGVFLDMAAELSEVIEPLRTQVAASM